MRSEDIELGEILEVERKSRAGVVVSVRLSADEADELQRLAEQRGTTLSKVAREAITSYLAHGPNRGIEIGPWTGTVSSSKMGGSFELTFSPSSSTAETAGSVREFSPTP